MQELPISLAPPCIVIFIYSSPFVIQNVNL
jgi:hypothetical protein